MDGADSKFQVIIRQTGECFSCSPTESLLTGMTRLGRRGIPVGCQNGGCGVCKVRLLRGTVHKLGPISRCHVSIEEEQAGCSLACRVAPQCEVELEVVGKMQKPFFKGFACQASHVSTE